MGIFKTQEIRAAGAIDHLIRLPEDDVASRLKSAIVVALVANAAVFTVAFSHRCCISQMRPRPCRLSSWRRHLMTFPGL